MKDSSIKELKRESSINHLTVRVRGKKLDIDLSKELAVNETSINTLISENPSSYSLISILKSKAVAARDQLEREKDRIFSQVYVSVVDSNPKATKEYATHKANANTKYQVANDKFLEAKEYADKLISICKAFEMKAQLLQTFSSNIRKE